MGKQTKEPRKGPNMKYETGPYSYASRKWYTSNVGGAKAPKRTK